MIKGVIHTALAGLLLLPAAAIAEPIALKLAFGTSDQSISYQAAARPFVEAVNTDGQDLIKIEPYFSGMLEKDFSQLPSMLRNGTADIAYIIPGLTRSEFPDNPVLQLPGLFRDAREATQVFANLIAAKALRGYDDFFVISAYVGTAASFHSRLPIGSLKDLQGRKIRINSPNEGALLKELGATPILMPVNQITSAINVGSLDVVMVPPSPMADFGIKRLLSNHYMLETSGAPLVLLMSRKKFESLPVAAQELIRRYSGEWLTKNFIETNEAADRKILDEMNSDRRRTVTYPSTSDRSVAANIFKGVTESWAAESPRNAELLRIVRDELAKIRQSSSIRQTQ